MPSYFILLNNYTYDDYGALIKKEITGEANQTYTFEYKNNAARDLLSVGFGAYKFKPLSDVYGRNTGKEIYNGANKLAAEYISYRKVGDHATNMPATVWYANGTTIKDSIKYTYDKCGNIASITENGHIIAKYTYDSLNRLIREDNKKVGITVLYTYDTNGNITERCEYAYTSKTGEELSELGCTHYSYDYIGDRLVGYNGETFTYNSLGNPTTYRGKEVSWQYGKRLADFGGTTFTYDGLGRRTSKNEIRFIYDNEGRLIKQSDGLEFVYDNAGVVGVKYNDTQYFYRKDAQGNIIALLDNTGNTVVEYVYDSWGNHAIVGENGETVTEGIGVLNPYRYRGYYYDAETGLYYLQTRYYDPEIGRFISQDSIEYADPETINGLNLYAYCNNNPVMNVDPTGEFFLSFLIVGIVGAISAAVASMVVQVATTGEVDWAQVGISALFGAVSGILSFTGIGGVIGQFVIQGALAVGEMYSIAALNGTASLIGPEEVVATFLFAGVLGTIGSGSAADNFKHVTKIEGAFTKYSFRDIFKKSKPIFSTLLKRGAKYLGEFVKPLIKQTMVLGFVTAVVSTLNYWVQKVYDAFN